MPSSDVPIHPLLPDDDRVAYSVAEVMLMTGLSQSTIFRRIKSGRLKTRRSEGRTLVLRRDLAAYLETLPEGGGGKAVA